MGEEAVRRKPQDPAKVRRRLRLLQGLAEAAFRDGDDHYQKFNVRFVYAVAGETLQYLDEMESADA